MVDIIKTVTRVHPIIQSFYYHQSSYSFFSIVIVYNNFIYTDSDDDIQIICNETLLVWCIRSRLYEAKAVWWSINNIKWRNHFHCNICNKYVIQFLPLKTIEMVYIVLNICIFLCLNSWSKYARTSHIHIIFLIVIYLMFIRNY